MAIPDEQHPVWADLLQGRRLVELEFIAARMLIVRLRLTFIHSPTTLPQACAELRALFARNVGLASAQRDLQKLGA